MRLADRRRIARMRVSAQQLARPTASGGSGGGSGGGPADTVRRMLAVQAQDYAAGLWAVGVRAPGTTAADVERELEEGALVRSWPMRGTLHLVAADDLGWLGDLGRPRVNAAVATRHRQLGLDATTLDRAAAVADEALAEQRMTRAALLARLQGAGIDTEGQRGAHLIGWLARHEVIVLTARQGVALWRERIPSPRRLDREDALAELAARYVSGHGPATERDLAWWAGLTLADARAAVDAVRDRFERLEADGATYWHEPGLAEAPASAHALPGFDELALGYSDREAMLGDSDLERLVPGRNGMFLSTLVLDGAIAATWRREGNRIRLDPWRELPPSRAGAIRAAFARWGRFTGREAHLEP